MGGSAVVSPLSSKFVQNPLLQFDFGQRLPFAHERRSPLEGFASHAVYDFARLQMAFELRWRPTGFELLHQVRGADHFLLQLADQLDGAGVHQADVGNIIFGRILHRDVFTA